MMRLLKNKSRIAVITLFFCIFMLFCFCTICYSAFSSTMNINGISYSRVEADVRITDFNISDTTNGSISMYESFGKDFISSEVNLKSNSSITYNLEITNYGSADVGIYSISGIPDEVSYSIKGYNLNDKICDDSGICNSFIKKTYEFTLSSTSAYSGSIQINFDFRTYHKVTYTGINVDSSYPIEVMDGTDLVINFKEDLNNISILSNGVEISFYNKISIGQTITVENVGSEIEVKFIPPGIKAKLVSGDLDTVGSEVCIKDECFYIISSDNSKVTMFAKYNLYVGNVCTSTSSCTTYGSEATGLQNSTMLGYFPSKTERTGVTDFSSSPYWGSVSNGKYVYNSSSKLYNHVENYKKYLESIGVTVEEARLIKYDELLNIGCSGSSCLSAPSWVYTTSFWSGSACDSEYIWRVYSDGDLGDNRYYATSNCGVRPVITIPRTEIDVTNEPSSGNKYDFSASLGGYPVMARAGIEAIITFDDTVPESFPIKVNFYLKYSSEDDSAYQLVYSDIITNNSDYYYSDYAVDIYQSYDLKVVLESNDGVTKTYYSTIYTECFVSGTKVLVEDGYRNIEDIKVGDYVYALDLDTNERVLKKVTRKYEGSAIETYEITVNGEKIITTPKHEFYVIDKGWVRAFDLKVGDVLNSFNNGKLEITDIKYIKHEKPIKVYNMTIEGLHNYLISSDQLLVHNSASDI